VICYAYFGGVRAIQRKVGHMSGSSLDENLGPIQRQVPCGAGRDTHFAPAARDGPDELARKAREVQNASYLQQTIDAMPGIVAILNDNRQVVAANSAMLALLNPGGCPVASKRLGEAIGCIRAKEGPNGCGTARHCATCGAVRAILESQAEERKVTRECRITTDASHGNAALDLRVTATPFHIGRDRFIVVAVEDMSQAKRLAVLQRAFFHDALNTAGCLQGYSQYLAEEIPQQQDVCDCLLRLSNSLIESIQSQRDLFRAEAGDLETRPEPLTTRLVLEEVRSSYLSHSAAEGRNIEVRCDWAGTVVADRHLLQRVLGNMLKNALEATVGGGTVVVNCRLSGDEVVFTVNNSEVMPEEVQLQIFQRSFSTKGQPGRGIGTYSIKLLGERYLGGKVGFTSQAPEGTTFWLALPAGAVDRTV
jgi:signal transduction histidine kinase